LTHTLELGGTPETDTFFKELNHNMGTPVFDSIIKGALTPIHAREANALFVATTRA
jgi:hypothetical protein